MAETREKPDAAVVRSKLAEEDAAMQEALAEMSPLSAHRTRAEKATIANEALADEVLKARIAAYKAQYPNLSEADIKDALGIARTQLEEANRESTLKLLVAAEKARLRIEEGLVTGATRLDEMVAIEIDCQDWQNPIVLNGRQYLKHVSGMKPYVVPRHVANVILELCDRGRRAERDRLNESWTEAYRKPHNTKISAVKGVINPPMAA